MVFAPTSLIGWRPLAGPVVSGGPVRAGMFVEGWSLRTELDSTPMWAVAVCAARNAATRPTRAAAVHRLAPQRHAAYDREHAVLDAREQVNDDIAHEHISEHHQTDQGGVIGGYDPDRDAEPDFSCAAYVFAFWRLCQQHTATNARCPQQVQRRPVHTAGPVSSGRSTRCE
jgi:hypothetical protein